MGISALTPPPNPEDLHETLLEFANNRLLIDLCGEFDRNLAQIEHQLGIHILRRGNHLPWLDPLARGGRRQRSCRRFMGDWRRGARSMRAKSMP